MSTSDAQRGIQNAHERVAKLPSRTPVGDRFLDEKYNRQNGGVSEEERASEIEQEEMRMEQERRAEEEEQARRQRIIQAKQMLHEQGKKLAIKHALKGRRLGTKNAMRFVLGIALTAYVWQLLFAIGALLGFGIHAQVLYIRHETALGKLVGLIAEFQTWLPFEDIGYGFWGLGLIIIMVEFICFYAFFRFLGYNPMKTSISLCVTAVCLAFSIFPITNIFPWLVLWVIYISLFSSDT